MGDDQGEEEGGAAVTSVENCPKCHGAIEFGYGLAFGGFGAYQFCENESCDWREKDRECPKCEGIEPCGCPAADPSTPKLYP